VNLVEPEANPVAVPAGFTLATDAFATVHPTVVVTSAVVPSL
jgi:hypothetical protein